MLDQQKKREKPYNPLIWQSTEGLYTTRISISAKGLNLEPVLFVVALFTTIRRPARIHLPLVKIPYTMRNKGQRKIFPNPNTNMM